jgi:hypothetical protein
VFRPDDAAATAGNPVAPPPPFTRARGSSRRLSIRANGTLPAAVAGQRFYHYQHPHHHHLPKAVVPLRYSNADIHISGWLSKRGKRLGSRVERFLILNGSTLSNARQEGARPTWAVNIRGCKVLSGPNREIIFKVNNNFSSFYAPDDIVHGKWIEALQSVSAVRCGWKMSKSISICEEARAGRNRSFRPAHDRLAQAWLGSFARAPQRPHATCLGLRSVY